MSPNPLLGIIGTGAYTHSIHLFKMATQPQIMLNLDTQQVLKSLMACWMSCGMYEAEALGCRWNGHNA